MSIPQGKHTLHIKAWDEADNTSEASRQYMLGTSAPVGGVLINGTAAYTNNASVTLTLSATDSRSGISQMRFSNDNSIWSAWEALGSTKNWTLTPGDGAKTVYAQFKDKAGNVSPTYSDSIVLTGIGPGSSVHPRLTIGSPSVSATSAGPVTFTVTYVEADTVTLVAANVLLNKTGTADGTVSVSGAGTSTRTVTVSGITGSGTLGISIAAGTAANAGGSATAEGPSETFTVASDSPWPWSGRGIVSIPLIPESNDPKPLIGFSNNEWLCYDTASSQYKTYPDLATWFEPLQATPGRGFWAAFPAGGGLRPEGAVPDQTMPKAIHLLAGWNLIGTPFVSEVQWDLNAIQVRNSSGSAIALKDAGNVVARCVWGWDPERHQYYLIFDSSLVTGVDDRLKPWQAYWILAYEECDLILPAP